MASTATVKEVLKGIDVRLTLMTALENHVVPMENALMLLMASYVNVHQALKDFAVKLTMMIVMREPVTTEVLA
jgi:hypothetical protein